VGHAANDPFTGTWQLKKAKSTIGGNAADVVKFKQFVFAPTTEGVMITETLTYVSPEGEKTEISYLPYVYGKYTPQKGPGMDALFVEKTDPHTMFWTAALKGKILSRLQVDLSDDGKLLTFRYLERASDPVNKVAGDRYVYERK
jgi:sugar (pentulose or hexulose) kinase